MDIFLCILVGLIAGVTGGLFGIGGGLIIVPALIWLLGFSQHKAQGTSLVALLYPVGLLGVFNYYKQNQVDILKGSIIAVGLFLGVFLGSKLALSLSEQTMRRVFAIFLVAVAIQLFFKK